MHNVKTLIISLITSLALAGQVFAAGNISIRLEQPKTPSNQNNFTITFTTLDTDTTQPITVKCFKKGPGDGGFSQFSSDITLAPAGGNSGNCQTSSSVITTGGTYQFYATATAGSGENATSETVSVDYNTSGPGDPRDYNKTKSSCTYTIHFRTAEDSGKTVKVEIYRSENTSFNTDSGTRVGTVSVGSNETRDFSDTPADCNKTYYYAIRSFDSAGNGSGVVGDSQTVTINPPTTVSPTPGQGAIAGGTGGNILGTGTGGAEGATGASTPTGQALGEATPAAEVVDTTGAADGGLFSGRTPIVIVAVILGAILLYAFATRKKS